MMVLALLLAGFFQAGSEPAAAGVWDRVVTARLTTIDLPARILGRGWASSTGIRIDDLEAIDDLDEPTREVARILKARLGSLGVRAVGDYTLVRKIFPLNTVTVRVFVFKDAAGCRAWWEKTYRFSGWEAQYKPVPSDQFEAVDSRKSNKRIVAFGNAVITAHQLGDGEEHLVALRYIVDAIIGNR